MSNEIPTTDFSSEKLSQLKAEAAAESTAVDPPKKKCSLTDVLPASVIPLVKAAPNNETIRSLLLAHLKVSVPKEEDTYDKVVQWIELNVEAHKPIPAVSTPPAHPRNEIRVEMEGSECESGSCDFSRNLRGTGEIPISLQEVIDAARSAGSRADFFGFIYEIIDENARDYIELDVMEGTETRSNYEGADSDGWETSITDAGKQALKNALRYAHPARYRELFEA